MSESSHKRNASSGPVATNVPATKARKVTDYFKPTNIKNSESENPATEVARQKPTTTSDDEDDGENDKPTIALGEKATTNTEAKNKKPATSPTNKEGMPLPRVSKLKSSLLSSPTLTLSYHKGDIFSAPPQSLLIHACNTQGSWGAGIAAAFRTRYPAAYKVYRDYCLKTHNPVTKPVSTGTCLLIPPCETTNGKPKHWIGCLFTSAKYGKMKDKPDVILQNTAPAMKECLAQAKVAVKDGNGVGEVRMCRINSARFAVKWERTVEELEGIVVEDGWKDNVEVWSID
ncbi:hypothetical protein P280DRAFT_465247 [Massarina eburnea CBS 473.64]|uniref:ADP-ribose 1''-phosphate phosphatase n=1 Tax=Massarina eburnea CBS 473.64 TaxID=1395130 RepID=A0A6A6SG32_9PLEO|nr:hypothetical protein P280DRAFT_465247 [Massarina eburnea CBS 473.64]